jgi:heat shock protein HslJ
MPRQPVAPPAKCLLAVAALAAVLVLAAACGSSGGSSSQSGAVKALEARLWTATQIAGVSSVLPAKSFASTAQFAAGTVSGSGCVNQYSASYTAADDGTIKIQRPTSTLMAGPPKANAQEQAFFKALTEAATFAVNGDTLKLFGPQGDLLVTFVVTQPAQLTGTTWSAVAYNNGKGALQSLAEGSEITAIFGTDGSLTGLASVNTYTAKYTVQGDGKMTIDPHIATTAMAGPEKYMAQEQAYLAALPRTVVYVIQGDELWLRDAEGAALAQYVAR